MFGLYDWNKNDLINFTKRAKNICQVEGSDNTKSSLPNFPNKNLLTNKIFLAKQF